jgi:hypothetical protein
LAVHRGGSWREALLVHEIAAMMLKVYGVVSFFGRPRDCVRNIGLTQAVGFRWASSEDPVLQVVNYD